MPQKKKMEKIFKKYKLGEAPNDVAYWRTQSHEERLATLEDLRREFHSWTDEIEPRLERVYRIVKRK